MNRRTHVPAGDAVIIVLVVVALAVWFVTAGL